MNCNDPQGTRTENGTCTCNAGYAGNNCQFNAAPELNSRLYDGSRHVVPGCKIVTPTASTTTQGTAGACCENITAILLKEGTSSTISCHEYHGQSVLSGSDAGRAVVLTSTRFIE